MRAFLNELRHWPKALLVFGLMWAISLGMEKRKR